VSTRVSRSAGDIPARWPMPLALTQRSAVPITRGCASPKDNVVDSDQRTRRSGPRAPRLLQVVLTPEQKRHIAALRAESRLLAQVNARIVALGGEPIPIRSAPDRRKKKRSA
jgi:hypothetical protein